MNPRILIPIALVASVLLLTPSHHDVSAHGGGLDANGGHYNRKTGEYHIHRPRSTPQGGTRSESPGEASGLAQMGLKSTPAPADPRVEALIRLLARKGVITESEAELLGAIRR